VHEATDGTVRAGYLIRGLGNAAATGLTTSQARHPGTGTAAAGIGTETGTVIVTGIRQRTIAAETGTAGGTTGTGTASGGRAAEAATGRGTASASGLGRISTAMAATRWMMSTSRTHCAPSSA